jgi:predicted nucleic acid-binding protein
MVDWCRKHRELTKKAKSKCSDQCSSRCDFFHWLSESDLENWRRKKSPPQPLQQPQPQTPPSPLPEKTPKKRWILIDANILINAKEEGKKDRICQRILCENRLATTYLVKKEARGIDINLKIFKITKISQELKETRLPGLKQASTADKSLIQAAVNYHTIIGIITYDNDFFNIAAKGYVERKSNYKRHFLVKTAKEYLISIGALQHSQ